jgi:UDP-glucose 4-epimerase
MNIGIVGSSGFIGKSLVTSLRLKGHTIIEFGSEDSIVANSGKLSSRANNVDAIIWAATRVNPITARINSRLVLQELKDWDTFLTLWRKSTLASSPLFFLSSGGCVYTGQKVPFNEESEANGVNEYGRLKIEMEKRLHLDELNAIVIRIGNVYGGGQPIGRGQGVIAEWANNVRSNQDISVFGSLDSFRDYIHIDDVNEAFELMISHPPNRGTYNLSSGYPTSLNSLIQIFSQLANKNLVFQYDENRPTDRNGYYLDIMKLQASINWVPQVELAVGVTEAIMGTRESD